MYHEGETEQRGAAARLHNATDVEERAATAGRTSSNGRTKNNGGLAPRGDGRSAERRSAAKIRGFPGDMQRFELASMRTRKDDGCTAQTPDETGITRDLVENATMR